MAKNPVSKPKFIGSSVAAFVIMTTACAAQNSPEPRFYGYSPDSALSIGHGFDPNDITAPKLPCIIAEVEPIDSGAPKTTLRASYVRNQSELFEASGISSKIDVDYLSVSGDVSFSTKTENSFDDDTINIVLTAKTDFGRWALKAKPQPELDSAQLKKSPDVFARNCGTRYVAIEERGAAAWAKVMISGSSRKWRQTFTGHMSAGGGFGPVDGSASVDLSNEMKRAAKENRISVEVGSTGGKGMGTLDQVVKSLGNTADPLSSLFEGLAAFIRPFDKENASPIRYHVASMEQLGWSENNIDPWTEMREARLEAIVKQYRMLSQAIANAQDYASGGVWADVVKSRVGSIDTTSLKDDIKNALVLQKELADAHRRCKQSGTEQACEVQDEQFPKRSVDNVFPTRRVKISRGTGAETEQDRVVSIFSPTVRPRPRFWIRWSCRDDASNTPDCNDTNATQRFYDDIAVRAVLSSPPSRRLGVLKTFRPAAKNFIVMLDSEMDPFIVSKSLSFVSVDGDEYQIFKPSAADTWIEEWQTDRPEAWDGAYAVPAEVAIQRFMNTFPGDHQGSIIIDLQDGFGRHFKSDLLSVKWTSDGKNATDGSLDY